MVTEEVSKTGLLKIASEADRVMVASILYKNGYSVTPVRLKKNQKSYEYYVRYSTGSSDENGGNG